MGSWRRNRKQAVEMLSSVFWLWVHLRIEHCWRKFSTSRETHTYNWSTLHLKPKCPNFTILRPDQLTVNCYKPGNGIPSHCDTLSSFVDPIVSLSLDSSALMKFKQPGSQRCGQLWFQEDRFGNSFWSCLGKVDLVGLMERHLGWAISQTFRAAGSPRLLMFPQVTVVLLRN